MPNNASPSYEQIFYLGGTGVSGIRNLSAGYSVAQKTIRALGAGFVQEVIAEPLRGEMSMTRDMLYQDPVLGLTGEAPVSGTLLYGVELVEKTSPILVSLPKLSLSIICLDIFPSILLY